MTDDPPGRNPITMADQFRIFLDAQRQARAEARRAEMAAAQADVRLRNAQRAAKAAEPG